MITSIMCKAETGKQIAQIGVQWVEMGIITPRLLLSVAVTRWRVEVFHEKKVATIRGRHIGLWTSSAWRLRTSSLSDRVSMLHFRNASNAGIKRCIPGEMTERRQGDSAS